MPTMPSKEVIMSKGGGSTRTNNGDGTSRNAKSKVSTSSKNWLQRHRASIVWVALSVVVVIIAILWYRHVQYTQEMARRKSKWWPL